MSAAAASMPETTAGKRYGRSRSSSLQSSTSRTSSILSLGVDESSVLLSHKTKEKRGNPRYEKTDFFAARHMLALMGCLGFFTVYALRAIWGVALVAMVKTTKKLNASLELNDECPGFDADNCTAPSSSTGEFEWDEETQGYILGAFFYGYICTQLPGGWLASRIGEKNLFGLGILNTAMLSIVTPFAARFSVYLLIAIRILIGIGEGVTYPAMHAMWGNWAPLWERSKLVGFTYAGGEIGTVIALPIAGLLCDSDFAGGWPSVFYVFGFLGCLWVLAWMLLISNTPSEHPRITAAERDYIETSIGKKEEIPTPWKSILTSSAVWAIAAGHLAHNCGFYTFLTCLPTYMKNILKFDIKENGFLSSLPYLASWIMENVSGFSADFLREHQYLSTLNTRRLFQTVGCVLPAGLLIIAGYAGCDHVLAALLLSMALGFSGLTTAGYTVSHLDIAPRFAGVLYGISNAVGTIPGFVGPALVGYLTNHDQTKAQWRIVFYITAAVYLIGALGYVIFVKGHELPWAKAPTKEIIVKEDNSVPYLRQNGQVDLPSQDMASKRYARSD